MADVEHLAELFAPLGGVSFKRMFGGYGIMKGGMMFALISRDELYFKADDAFADRFRAEGSRQWMLKRRGQAQPMRYWLLPERLYDEAEEFAAWARDAFAAAGRMRSEKKPGRARKPAATKPATSKPKPKTKVAPKRR
jgi:DNA transformation protein